VDDDAGVLLGGAGGVPLDDPAGALLGGAVGVLVGAPEGVLGCRPVPVPVPVAGLVDAPPSAQYCWTV
jgi:hypothetical protein